MMKIRAAGTPMILALLLAACSNFPRLYSGEFVQVVDVSGNLDGAFQELQLASTMDSVQLERLLARAEWDFKHEQNVSNRIRLALLLIAAGEPVRDRERAQALLNDIGPSEPITSGQQGLVQLLLQLLEEQDGARQKLDRCIAGTAEQETRINELEQQLRELTSIEQNIQHRDMPVGIENDR